MTRRSFTWRSLLTIVIGIPLWAITLSGSVLSRDLDGGIFLSVMAGLRRGLPLYSGIWDNKDPLFFAVMAGADAIHPWLPFVLDWMWLLLAALGAWLASRPFMPADRALVVAVIAVPLVLTGGTYAAGWSTTPGTALALLVAGLLASRRPLLAGAALAALAFVKLALLPIALAFVVTAILSRSRRAFGVRTLVSFAAFAAAGTVGLWALGWLSGYGDMLARNGRYAQDAMSYFGYADGPIGHLSKAWNDAGPWIIVSTIACLLLIAVCAWRALTRRMPSWPVIIAAEALVGVLGVLAVTYVWPHHTQVLALAAMLTLIAAAAALPSAFAQLGAMLVIVAMAVAVAGTSPMDWADRLKVPSNPFPGIATRAAETPRDARLLESVPRSSFTFARLGSNDDSGFLTASPARATLGCPEFHLYDFSPVEAFDRAWACLDTVDVVIVTDGFAAFAGGMRGPSAQAVLGKVDALFTCMRVEDRRLCTRTPGN